MEIVFENQAIKQLKKIPKAEIRKINSKIEKLSQNPHIGKRLQGELITLFALRAWPYRILYEIEKNKIIICSIGHRQGVYKK
ncbi:MAG: type II toxin-antitoxin system RelE/ParE family toxin [Microgenomates group bacterium]